MSSTPLERRVALDDTGCTPRRRVRHEVRDAVAVMAFSLATSCLLAGLLTLVVRTGG